MLLKILSSIQTQNIPVIDIYIESLCPDCTNFLGGSYKNFFYTSDHDSLATINFIPFGNAHESFNGQSYDFTCQHGPNECYGNTVEACLKTRLSVEQFHTVLLCIEGNIWSVGSNFPASLQSCVSDSQMVNDVLTCASNMEGNGIMHQMAQLTPQHSYVPWVHFNGVHDVYIENRILSNILNYLCAISGYKSPSCRHTLVMSTDRSEKQCVNTFDAKVNEAEALSFLN